MLKQYFNFISVFCLLVVFISQPLAAARPSCETMHPDTQMVMHDAMTVGNMNHAHHSIPSSDSQLNDSQTVIDCCEEQVCSMASCFSLSAMVVAAGLQLTPEFSNPVLPDYRAVYAGIELVSPYRPPFPANTGQVRPKSGHGWF